MALETFYEAVDDWNRRDVESVFARLEPDLEFIASGIFPDIPLRLRGAEIRDFFTDWLEAWETIRVEPFDVEENGERVLAQIRFVGTGRAGVEVERAFFWVMRIREGRIAEWRSFATREDALAAF